MAWTLCLPQAVVADPQSLACVCHLGLGLRVFHFQLQRAELLPIILVHGGHRVIEFPSSLCQAEGTVVLSALSVTAQAEPQVGLGTSGPTMTGQTRIQEVETPGGTVTAADGEVPQPRLSKPSILPTRPKTNGNATLKESIAPPGQALTGKQEHCMTVMSMIQRQC